MKNTVKSTKTINGNNFEVTLEKGTWTEKISADGWDCGTEEHLINNLTIKANGNIIGSELPKLIDTEGIWFKGQKAENYKNGARYESTIHGCFGAYLSGPVAITIIEMIDTVTAEMAEEIDEATKALEIKIAEKKMQTEKNEEIMAEMDRKDLASGLCPKCGSYCHGDCESN